MNSQYKVANIFTDTFVESFPRHVFNKSYTNSFTCNHGYLYPAFVKPVIPGDKFTLNSYGRVQLTPLATNSMQNIKCYMRYFYVPNRIVWDKWDKFISQDGFAENPILAPFTTLTGAQMNNLMTSENSLKLLDFLGVQFDNRYDTAHIPYTGDAQVSFNLFKFFSYWLIWDVFFRDQNIQNPIFSIDNITSGYNPFSLGQLNELLPIAKEKDYFTTALPWTQKGQPVNLNATLIGQSPIQFTQNDADGNPYNVRFISSGVPYRLDNKFVLEGSDISQTIIGRVSSQGQSSPYLDSLPVGTFPLSVQMSDPNQAVPKEGFVYGSVDGNNMATTFTINELRYANALQRYLERLALGGNRPAEFYLSMYGVKIDDLRLGNPLYLGGGSTYVHVTSIAQTIESETAPLATLGGNGQAQCSFSINEPYYASEFGYVFGMFYIRPELNYTQGLPRDMQLFSHLDFYNPIFAHLGEEPVKKSELMLKSDIVINPAAPEFENDDTFGYQSRYAYLKQSNNEVHGLLKSTLSKWLLSSRFETVPTLNNTFIVQPQNYDIFAVIEGVVDHYIVELRHEFEVESSMPDFSIPSL